MQKEVKQHVTYGVLIAVIFVSTLFYQNSLIEETKDELTQQISELRQQLEASTEQLEQKDQSLEQSVQQLDTSLEEKEKEIGVLSGELDTVREKSEQEVAALQETISGLRVEFSDFSEVIETAVKGVVSVQTNVGSGSGFHIGDGNIVTNYHVIDGASAARVVTHDGKQHSISIVGSNERADISVLRINNTRYKRLRFGDSDELKVGQKVIAIGNPGGLDFTVTQGIVSATDREDERRNEYTQIDVPINPGNSGGPLINSEGEVVGVNTLKIRGFEGVGFALDSNYVDEVIERIIE